MPQDPFGRAAKMSFRSALPLLFFTATAAAVQLAAPAMLRDSSLSGGFVVFVGTRDAQLAQALAQRGSFLVQMLDSDDAAVQQARRSLHAAGCYGLASASRLDRTASLPYTENLVNLIIVGNDAPAPLSGDEVIRVLCPGGAAITSSSRLGKTALLSAGFELVRSLGDNGSWLIGRKPWPSEMDQWPQPRHGPDGNVVSQDTLVGPPRRVRWVAGPPQEISNMLSAAGRNFYGGVLARDAFNGLRLWERKLDPSPARGGFGYRPSAETPLPIAAGAYLLAVHEKKVVALDPSSGREVRSYPDAGVPEKILSDAGLLITVDRTAVRALDLESASLAWKYDAAEPRCAVAGDGNLYLLEGGASTAQPCGITRLSLENGQVSWKRVDHEWMKNVRNLVYHDGALACEISTLTDTRTGNGLRLLSADDGRLLSMRNFLTGMSHYHQARTLFIDDLVWIQWENNWYGTDWRTGEGRYRYMAGTGHCFPPVATARYLMAGEMHMTDISTGLVDVNPITKGNCSRDGGFMPANGLIYTAPKHCICWPMLRDYSALAPAKPKGDAPRPLDPPYRRESGSASAPAANAPSENPDDWPCYRHDAWRSGSTTSAAPLKWKLRWRTNLGDRPTGPIADDWRENPFLRSPISAPVSARSLVYIARGDSHELVALDARTGQDRWRFTADARIDTPPTIHRGLCLFGSSGGSVYCLRADDGALIWRLRIALNDEQIIAYGQVESPWPVPGSVLLSDDVAYIAAGRHPLADGGIRVFAFKPATGDVLWHSTLKSVPQTDFYDSTGLEFDHFDLLHREGKQIAMSRWLFDRATGAITCKPKSGFAQLVTGGSGVIVPRGFWSYAPRNETEHNSERPFVRPPLCFRDNSVFGLSEDRRTVFRRDFNISGGEKFDMQWFKGWDTYASARKGGDLWRTQRLARGAKWTAEPFATISDKHRGGAIIMAPNAIIVASQLGALTVLSPDDGKTLSTLDIPPVAWDGLALASGQLLISTQAGEILCLEANGDTR